MLAHLDGLDAQLARARARARRARDQRPMARPGRVAVRFGGIGIRTALGLLAEIGDFRRFGSARELMSFLGLTVAEYSSGDRQHRGHLTKTGNRHARRLLIEAAWHYRHPPRRPARTGALAEPVSPAVDARAWQAQIRLHHRARHLTTTASARPSRPPPSPASSPASSGPP